MNVHVAPRSGSCQWEPMGNIYYGSKLNHQGTADFVHVSIYQGSILGTYF